MTRKELEKVMMDLIDIAKLLKEEDKTKVYKITLDNMEKRLKEAVVEIEEEKNCDNCKYNPDYNEAYDSCKEIVGGCYGDYNKWKPRSK